MDWKQNIPQKGTGLMLRDFLPKRLRSTVKSACGQVQKSKKPEQELFRLFQVPELFILDNKTEVTAVHPL